MRKVSDSRLSDIFLSQFRYCYFILSCECAVIIFFPLLAYCRRVVRIWLCMYVSCYKNLWFDGFQGLVFLVCPPSPPFVAYYSLFVIYRMTQKPHNCLVKCTLKHVERYFITYWIFKNCSTWYPPGWMHNLQMTGSNLNISVNLTDCFMLTNFWTTLYCIRLHVCTLLTRYNTFQILTTKWAIWLSTVHFILIRPLNCVLSS
jgi:hypothetical protein